MSVTVEQLEGVLGYEKTGYKEPTFDCPFCKIRLRRADYKKNGRGSIHVNIAKDMALCLSGNQSIITDAGILPIYRVGALLKKGPVKVLSSRGDGKLEWKKVVNWYNNGPQGPDGFLKIKTEIDSRNGILLTPEHELFDASMNRVRADSLRSGDLIRAKDYEPSGDQWQVLYGTLLGDGFVGRGRDLRIEHGEEQLYYLNWKMNSFPKTTIRERILDDGWGRRVCYQGCSTNMRSAMRRLRKIFYPAGEKIVPQEVLSKLSPLGIAVWFMDDGSFRKRLPRTSTENPSSRFALSYQGFDCTSRVRVQKYFDDIWGWRGCEDMNNVLVFDAKSSRSISNILSEFIREDHSKSRNTKVFLCPEIKAGCVGSRLVEVESIDRVKVGDVNSTKNRRYCLEVEDNHNFFTANGILVGNCHRCDYKTRSLKNLIRQLGGKLPKSILRKAVSGGALAAVRKIFAAEEEVKKKKKVRLPEGYRPITFPLKSRIAKKFVAYLNGRGVSDEMIEDCNIGYACSGRCAGMLVFPMYVGNSLKFYTSRSVLPIAYTKTLHAEVERGGLVFNYNQASRAKRVFVSEGPFDAYAWPSEIGVGTATLGHKIHPDQARMFATMDAEEFVVCYDADAAASTLESAHFLSKYVNAAVSYIILPRGDPNSMRKHLKKYYKRRKMSGLQGVIRQKFYA